MDHANARCGYRRLRGGDSYFKSANSDLIQEHEIINLISASSLSVLRKQSANRKPAPKAVAVLADPVFDADDARVKASVKRKSRKASSSRDQHPTNAVGALDTSSIEQ